VNSSIEKTDELEFRIRNIDSNITENYYITDEKIKNCGEALDILEENIAAEIIARELLEEREVKEMKMVETNLALELKKAKKESKEVERDMLSQVEHHIHVIKVDFVEELKRLEEIRKENTEIIEERLIEIHQSLKEEKAIREETQNKLSKSINSKLSIDIPKHFKKKKLRLI